MAGVKRFLIMAVCLLLATASLSAETPASVLDAVAAATYDSSVLGASVEVDTDCPFSRSDVDAVIDEVWGVVGLQRADVTAVSSAYSQVRDRSVYADVEVHCIDEESYTFDPEYSYRANVYFGLRVDGVRHLIDWRYGGFGIGFTGDEILEKLDSYVSGLVIAFVSANAPRVSFVPSGMREFGLAAVARTNAALEG